jgi:DNA-binding beta-propeller fold protein YncE
MRVLASIGLATALAIAAGCAVERTGLVPPTNDIYYPLGVLAHPAGRYVYVSNTNYDLKYNAGYVSVIDLDAIIGKTLDPKDPWNLHAIIGAKTTLAFGGLPTFNHDASRFFLPVRQDDTLHIFDVSADGSSISCGNGGFTPHVSCDTNHAFHLSGLQFDPSLDDTATLDPYSCAIGPIYNGLPGEFLYIGYLSAGTITVFDVTKNAITNPNGFAAVALIGRNLATPGVGLSTNVNPLITSNGIGAVVVAGGVNRKGYVYAGSRTLITVNNNTTIPPPVLYYFDPSLAVTGAGTVGAVDLTSIVGGTDVRAMTTSPDGSRTYAIMENPDSLLQIDTSLDLSGNPRNIFLNAADLEMQAQTVLYVQRTSGHDLLYVSGFGSNNISIYDAETMEQVGEILTVSSGPTGLAVAYRADGPYVIATYFNDDAVIVIDATSPDPGQHHAIARIGQPRVVKDPT